MKLWLLRPIENEHIDYVSQPINFGYDCTFGFVIRAETEQDARAIAQENGSWETSIWVNGSRSQVYPAWTDPTLSTCVELTADGESGVVIEDHLSG